jgi:hypothetical protein
MRDFSAAMVLGAMVFLTCGLRAEESTNLSRLPFEIPIADGQAVQRKRWQLRN